MRKVLLLVFISFIGLKSWAQTTYTWNVASGDLDAAASWSPARNSIASNDILVFDGNVQASVTVTNIPTRETVGKISIINNCAVTFSSGTTTAVSGTATRSGTSVTGTSTAFTTDFIAGDIIIIGTSVNDIVSISSATALTDVNSGTLSSLVQFTNHQELL